MTNPRKRLLLLCLFLLLAVLLVASFSTWLARESTRIPRIFNRPELVVVDILPMG